MNGTNTRIKGTGCMITSLIMANFLFCFTHSFVFFILGLVNIRRSGSIFIVLTSLFGMLGFIITIPYSVNNYNYNKMKTKKARSYKAFYIGWMIVYLLMVIACCVFYKDWYCGAVYTVFIVLSLCFYPCFLAVFVCCVIVYAYRVKRFDKAQKLQLPYDYRTEPTCCCQPEEGEPDPCECCSTCCAGVSIDPNRERINNSCCCDGCCNCCIDCCIEGCGEANVNLPGNLTNQDVIYVGENHRIIYQPPSRSPTAVIPMQAVATPAEYIPTAQPIYNNEYSMPANAYTGAPMNSDNQPLYSIPMPIQNMDYNYNPNVVMAQPTIEQQCMIPAPAIVSATKYVKNSV